MQPYIKHLVICDKVMDLIMHAAVGTTGHSWWLIVCGGNVRQSA